MNVHSILLEFGGWSVKNPYKLVYMKIEFSLQI